MTTALLITTYNSPRYLQLTLQSVERQTVIPDEIIIADDGSTDETREMIESFRGVFGDRLKHVWQPDEGFQVARIRNKAIAASDSDYIIMIDGDVILDRHFVADHLKFARPGAFVAGMRAKLTPETTRKVMQGIIKGSPSWWKHRMDLAVYSIREPWLTPLIKNHHQGSVRQLISCNLAAWREDIIRVNGYDEGFTTWGEEDREFAARLYNIGLIRRNMLFSGIQYHLDHGSRADDTLRSNGERLMETIASRKQRCERGVDQYL